MDSQDVRDLKCLFYQGAKFDRVIELADALIIGRKVSVHDLVQITTIKSAAEFELGNVENAHATLQKLKEFEISEYHRQHALGRLSYMSGQFTPSWDAFEVATNVAENSVDYFRASLGKANVAYSMQEWESLSVIIDELIDMSDVADEADMISLSLISGHLALYGKNNPERANDFYFEAYSLAHKKGWGYYENRAFYSLGVSAKIAGKNDVAESYLNLMEATMVDEQDVYFKALIDQRFHSGGSVFEPLQVDSGRMSIQLGQDICWELHDKPQIYRFLELLTNKDDFVTKQDLAERLWPEEGYRRYVHDPRIYDLAKRIRQMFVRDGVTNIKFVSGRAGYRLTLQAA